MVTRPSDKQTERRALNRWDDEGGAPHSRSRSRAAEAVGLKAGSTVKPRIDQTRRARKARRER